MLLDNIHKAKYDDSPWVILLRQYRCYRDAARQPAPCPCTWRRGVGGPVSDGEAKEYRWDWRDCKAERNIRLALQHRELTEIPR